MGGGYWGSGCFRSSATVFRARRASSPSGSLMNTCCRDIYGRVGAVLNQSGSSCIRCQIRLSSIESVSLSCRPAHELELHLETRNDARAPLQSLNRRRVGTLGAPPECPQQRGTRPIQLQCTPVPTKALILGRADEGGVDSTYRSLAEKPAGCSRPRQASRRRQGPAHARHR